MSATRTARNTTTAKPEGRTRNGRTANPTTETPAKATPKAKGTPKVKAKPQVEQVKLSDLEQAIIATLRKEGVAADDVTKDRLRRWDAVCDEGRLQYYTVARYGSAHDSDWISPAVVKRVRKGLAS